MLFQRPRLRLPLRHFHAGRHGLAYLFIGHDLAMVRVLAHRVLVLRAGRVVEEGEAAAEFAAPRDPYTVALMAAAFPDAPAPMAVSG